MDTEHWQGLGFSSIGLAFASTLEPIDHPIDPAALYPALEEGESSTHQHEGSSQGTAIAESVCFNIRGFERAHPTRERIWGPPDQDIDVHDVASKVMGAVQQWKGGEPEKPLILVTYASQAELGAISSLIPQLVHLVSDWVDVQPLVMDAYHARTSYTRLDGLSISLKYAMKSLCFPTGYQPKHLHHAGNDALRTLAIMACVTHEDVQFRRLTELEHVLRAERDRRAQRHLKGTAKSRGLLGKRPGPPSRYPHVAKVTMVPTPDVGEEQGPDQPAAGAPGEQDDEGQLHLPAVDVWSPYQVWDFFSPYEPNAIARACKEKCYYVCVPSPVVICQLIEDLDHTSDFQGARLLLVEDVSDVRALGAARREERAKLRQGREEEIFD